MITRISLVASLLLLNVSGVAMAALVDISPIGKVRIAGQAEAKKETPTVTKTEPEPAATSVTSGEEGLVLESESSAPKSEPQAVPEPEPEVAATTAEPASNAIPGPFLAPLPDPIESEVSVVEQPSTSEPEPKPIAEVGLSGEALQRAKNIYQVTCFACHDNGVLEAPVLGNKEQWQSRIDTGIDALKDSAINGKKFMPPKGGVTTLSDQEVAEVVEYMVMQVR
jgi:cytochrome c5